jgi:phosphatidylserine/phosphatidylglycerophosphate/cardiolipin synthase-like enzyme
MSKSSIIIEIPIEIIHAVFRVEKEDPLKPLIDTMKSIKNIESKYQSLYRLDAIARLSSTTSEVTDFSIPIIRDLWKGKYWAMKEQKLSIDDVTKGSFHRLEPIQRLDLNKSEGEVKDMVSPFMGLLSKKSGLNRNEVLGHTRLESLKSDSEVIFLKTKISQKEDSHGRKFWIYDEGPFKQIIGNHIDKEPGFEMVEPEVSEHVHDWPYSPEIQALYDLKKNPSKEIVSNILDTITSQIEQDNRPRLDSVKQVIGFRQDMWDAAQKVIKSSEKRVFILTSFSNSRFSSDVRELLAEASEGKKPEIIISFGEPDRGRSPEDIGNTEKYISTLAKDNRFKLKGDISVKSNHAKIIISDTGMVFIGSCNLFSGSLESGVLESGLLIKDSFCAKSIFEKIMEENWTPANYEKEMKNINSDLKKIKQPALALKNSIKDKIIVIKNDIRLGNKEYAYHKLERLLREIAEKPVWSLINTLEHRPFMSDCVDRFDKLIVMSSDGLKSNGLDKATINRIVNRASKNNSNVFIWWGRHAPNSKPFDEADKRGRDEARKQLQLLRRRVDKRTVEGKISQVHDKGFAFIGRGKKSVFVSPTFVKKYKLKKQDKVTFIQKENEGKKQDSVERFTRIRQESISSNLEKQKLGFYLCPDESNEPMETHAKMFIVDDFRLMISSDNTLSFGDTETERGDAGELGIMIDHPRLAIQTRGSMDLWLPIEAKMSNDLTRWWSLLGEEISFLTTDSSVKIPLINALDSVIERIESNDYLRDAWEKQIELNSDELEIINKLAMGSRLGVYWLAKSPSSQGIKSKLSKEQISNAVISLSGESVWQDSN